jgi:hypothetical protein
VIPEVRPALLLCAVLLAAACGRQAAETEKERKNAGEMTTAEILDQAARATYQPPVDSKLTERQIRMYLEVKRRSRENLQPNEPATSRDLRATLELGYNPKEMSWVRERMMDAWIALRGQELDRKIAESRARMLTDLETQARATTDLAKRANLEKQIAGIRSAPPVATRGTPAVEHNTVLIRRFESEVALAFSEERPRTKAPENPQEDRNAG